ncbi:MAG: hypothetical protein E6R03_14760 [Hyphomicrobiaceae bacterium]|nr:MAG: hypothetical protein E6R03_14760 [Hyphomicrobiaceae bacterium]
MILGDVKTIHTTIGLRLGRSTGGAGGDWHLALEDERSGINIVDLRLTDEQLGKLLGCGGVAVPAELFASALHGRVMRVKTQAIPILGKGKKTTYDKYDPKSWGDHVMKWLKANEMSEWTPDIEKQWSTHKYNASDQTYTVTLRKWVKFKPKSGE